MNPIFQGPFRDPTGAYSVPCPCLEILTWFIFPGGELSLIPIAQIHSYFKYGLFQLWIS